MAINFNSIPSNLRIPFVAVEIDSSKAQQGPSLLAYKAVLIGQKLAGGTATADAFVRCTSVNDAIALGGRGSMLHRAALAWFASNKSTELWLGVLADNAGGTAATGTIVVNTAATAAGTIVLYLGGDRLTVGVNAGDTATTIGAAIAAAITAAADLPVTAAAVTGTVTLTYRHKGTVGNAFDVRHSYQIGEALPAGVTVTITAMSAGATNPTLTNLIAAMSDFWFHIWSHPYTDATSLTAIETELATRFGPMRQQQGVAITSMAGTFTTHTTLGTGRNSPHSSIVAQGGPTPLTPPVEFAAETAALVAAAGAADPARPFQTLQYNRAWAVPESDQFDPSERNLLLFAGIATSKRVGTVAQIDRMITTYQTAPSGAADTAYLDVTSMLTLLYIRYDFRTRMQLKYPRHKLANDSAAASFGSGQAVMTPKLGKAEAISWFDDMQELGLVENADQFKRDLVVERDATDRNRLNFLLPPDLVNQLIVTGAQIQFLL